MGKDIVTPAKILVADDTETNQEILKRAFEKEGFQVVQAYDGISALETAEKEHPDLIMLDIMMPRMDGIDVLKRIKSMDSNILVVMMTAHGSEQIAVESMKLGADDYLTKPFHPKDVSALAHKLIKERAVRLENLRLREQIEKTERYLAHLVDSVNEAIISTDAGGRILSFNKAAEGLWGVSGSEMIGKRINELFFITKNPYYVDTILSETLEKGISSGEFLFVRPEGASFPGFLNTSLLREEADGHGIVALVRDLTTEKKLQQQLVESQKLASLGKVVEGVAHEVRNPLLSIGGFARRIDGQIPSDSPYKKYLQAIIKDVKRLEEMVSDIEEYLNFSRLHKLSFEIIDMGGLLRQLLKEFEGRISSGKIAVELNITPDLPEIYANEMYIRVLFSCLIENAIEAMPDGGKLTFNLREEENFFVTDVADTGKGITEDKIREIFNPFYTSKMRGAGLGLTKCHMIVTEHQGYIRVSSVPGKGTTFSVGLPVERRHHIRT